MSAVLLAALLAVVSAPSARAVWLGRLDPQQVMAPLRRRGSGATCILGPLWSLGSPGAPQTTGAAGGWAGVGGTAPHLQPLPQLMGSWYVLAVASGEKDFALEKATKSVEGVEVMLTSQNTLKMRASRHRWVGRGARLGGQAALPSLCTGLCWWLLGRYPCPGVITQAEWPVAPSREEADCPAPSRSRACCGCRPAGLDRPWKSQDRGHGAWGGRLLCWRGGRGGARGGRKGRGPGPRGGAEGAGPGPGAGRTLTAGLKDGQEGAPFCCLRMERCHLQAVELQRQNSGWVFGNPSLGVLEYRVLGTNFRDYAIVFTQLEAQEEAFSTVELYSECAGLLLQGCGPPPTSHQPHPSQKPPPSPAPASWAGGRMWRRALGSEGVESRLCGFLGWAPPLGPSPPSVPPGSSASPAGRTALASQEALGRFAKWSRSLGFLSQQQAELQRDFTCAHKVFL
ncbi:epididymal-specific lipocalin-6 [Dama dama]